MLFLLQHLLIFYAAKSKHFLFPGYPMHWLPRRLLEACFWIEWSNGALAIVDKKPLLLWNSWHSSPAAARSCYWSNLPMVPPLLTYHLPPLTPAQMSPILYHCPMCQISHCHDLQRSMWQVDGRPGLTIRPHTRLVNNDIRSNWRRMRKELLNGHFLSSNWSSPAATSYLSAKLYRFDVRLDQSPNVFLSDPLQRG